jgi:hypothetical protein
LCSQDSLHHGHQVRKGIKTHYKNLCHLRRPKTAGNAKKTARTEYLRRFLNPQVKHWSQTLRRLFASENRRKLAASFCGVFFPSEMTYVWLMSKTFAAVRNRRKNQCYLLAAD